MDETYILELYNQLGGEDKFGKIENFKNLISTNSGYQKQFYNSFGEQRLGSYDNFVGLVSGQKKKVIPRPAGGRMDITASSSGQPKERNILSELQFDKETYTPQTTAPEPVASNFVETSPKAPVRQAPSQFDPAKFVAPEQPLVPDSQDINLEKTSATKGFNTYYNTLDKAVNAGLVKDEKEFNQKFPDMTDLSFEQGKTQLDFIDKYDSLSDEIKQKIEPAIIRENGVITGINPNLISKDNMKFLQETAMDDDLFGKSSEEQAQLVLKNIVPQQKIDYLVEEKKLYSLQDSIVNSKNEIDKLINSGFYEEANLLVDKYNSELEQYKSLAKNLNEKSVIINSLDIAKDNFGMWSPVSTAASAVERFGSSVIMAIPSMAATGVNLILNLPGMPGEISDMGSDIEKSLMQIGMDMNKTWKDVIPTDSDDSIGNFIGDVSGQIGFVVGSAALGGAPAALAAGYTMSMSEMYEEATQNGLSHDDAMYLSKIYGGVSAPLEMLGAGGLIKKATGNALRNQIIKTVIKEGAEGFTREIAEQAVKLSFKPVIKETLKEGVEEGLQEGAQYLLSKGLAEAYNEYIKEDTDAEFKKTRMLREEGEAGFAGITKAFWGELGENIALGAVGGMIGGVGLNVMQGNVYTGSNYKAIESMLLDPKQMSKINDQLTAYRKNGTIKTDEELQVIKERVGIVQEAAANVDRATKAMPESFGIEQQKRTFALVAEKLSAEKQIEGMMPILAETKKAEIEQIDNKIRDIASGKITEADLIAERTPVIENIVPETVADTMPIEKAFKSTGSIDALFKEDLTETSEKISENLARNKSTQFEISKGSQEIVDMATKAANSIAKSIPGVRIVLHDTDAEFNKFYKDKKGGGLYDPNTNTIHINLSQANERTVSHETFHALVYNNIGDGYVLSTTKDMYNSVMRSLATSPSMKRKLKKFSDKYDNDFQNDEFVAELFGYLASEFKQLSAPIKVKIKQWINNIANKFNLSDIIKLTEQDLSDLETIEILNTLSSRISKGEAITEQEIDALKKKENKTDVKKTSKNVRSQLTEEESTEVSKAVVDRTIKGKKVPTFLKFLKKNKIEYLSFEGEISQENVRKVAPQSYNTVASKLSTYNTFSIDRKAQLIENIDGATLKVINKKISDNRIIVDKVIISAKKSIAKIKNAKTKTKEVKQLAIDKQLAIIEDLKNVKKAKGLVEQFESLQSIKNKSLSDKLYKSMFYATGPKLKKLTPVEVLNKSDEIYSKAKEIVKSNLLAVYDSVSPSIRKISKLWYDGANLIAQDMGASYGLTTEQSAAIIATQSPQMPWFDNLHLADVIMNTLKNSSDSVFTKEMFDYYSLKAAEYPKQKKYAPTLKKSIGKKLSELSNYDAGIFIRVDYDLNISRKAPIRIPTGTAVNESQTGDSSFSGYDVIEKGVSVFRDGSMENISKQLGKANKVRNFYLNIVDPSDERAVTMDTHAMAIALFKPLASNDIEVDFGPASFSFYADAYRELAEELGIEARALQSITWEAARAIFPAAKKAEAGYKKSISKIWDKFLSGEETLEEVQKQIFNQAKDPNITEWSDYIDELKNEKTRKNVSGRIIRYQGDKTNDKLGDVSESDRGVSTPRTGPVVDDARPGVKTGVIREQKDISEMTNAQIYKKAGTSEAEIQSLKKKNSKIMEMGKMVKRKMPHPEIALQGSKDLRDGKITKEEYDAIIEENFKPFIYTKVPSPATIKEILYSLSSDKIKKGIVGFMGYDLEEGRLVASRLDIPAYLSYGVYIDTLHDPLQNNKSIAYAPTTVLSNVEFSQLVKNWAIKVSTTSDIVGKGKTSKASVAVMQGNYKREESSVTKKRAEEALNSPDWVQIGYNPYRYSYFYNKNDMKRAVVSAEEVIQVGQLVLAKGVKYDEVPVTKIDDREIRFQLSDDHSIEESGKGIFDLKKGAKKIGKIILSSLPFNKSNPNFKYVELAQIDLEERGKGLSIDLYREVAEVLSSRGQVLASRGFRNEDSERIWKSLVRDGYAQKIGENKSNGKPIYAMLPTDPFGEVAASGIETNNIYLQENETGKIQPERTRDGGDGRTTDGTIKSLKGSPTVQGATGPDARLVSVAEKYAAENGIDFKRQSEYVEVDENRAKRLADEYAKMTHDPKSPKVKEAYSELIKQTKAQYKALVDAGYKFWFIDLNNAENIEYISSPYNAMRDLRKNKEMGVFPTEAGFGTDESIDVSESPLLERTGIEWALGGLEGKMMPVTANDLFRAVHDTFGHGLEGAGFRARGEENAWQAHVRLFTGPAIAAITTETRGQNSWVNYGPNGEQNRTASAEDTIFADQKTGLMPSWTWEEGRAGDAVIREQKIEVRPEIKPKIDERYGIRLGGIAYVPVDVMMNFLDVRGKRKETYESKDSRDRIEAFKKSIIKNGWDNRQGGIYLDVDAFGNAWIAEGNHRVIAAQELGMKEIPVEVKFDTARANPNTLKFDKSYAANPTSIISKERIDAIRKKVAPGYHIGYISIWETNLVDNKTSDIREQKAPENMPSKTLKNIKDRIQEFKDKGKKSKQIAEKVIAITQTQDPWYINEANDIEREETVRFINKESGLSQKRPVLLGRIKNLEEITAKELKAIARNLKSQAKTTKQEKQLIYDRLNDELLDLAKSGKISATKALSIIKRFEKVDVFMQDDVDSFVEYMGNIFLKADEMAKIAKATSKLKAAKLSLRKKLGIDEIIPQLKKLLYINPKLIASEVMDEYLELLQMVGARDKVLSLDEKNRLKARIQRILVATENKMSKLNELANLFLEYEAKVYDDNNKISYAATLDKMLADETIDARDKQIMMDNKFVINPTVRVKKTKQELQDEKDTLISEINNENRKDVPLIPSRYERDLIRNLKKFINSETLNKLSNADLKTLKLILSNLSNGFVTNQTQLMNNKLEGIYESKLTFSSVVKVSLAKIKLAYPKIKAYLKKSIKSNTDNNPYSEKIRSQSKFFLDQMLGDSKTTNLYDTLVYKLGAAEALFLSQYNGIMDKVNEARDNVAKSLKLDSNDVIESSAKQFLYLLELEYQANKNNPSFNPTYEYLKATLEQDKISDKDRKMLQELSTKFFVNKEMDIDKLYNSFNAAEKQSIKVVQDINYSLTDMAEIAAGIIRGDYVEMIDSYVHHVAIDDSFDESKSVDNTTNMVNRFMNSRNPSTKAKNLITRTGKVTPLNLDIYNSVSRGSKMTLMEYHLTNPIRVIYQTLKYTRKRLEESGDWASKREIYLGIESLMEDAMSRVVYSNIKKGSPEWAKFLTKTGYRLVLASSKRAFLQEIPSNAAFIMFDSPIEWGLGVKDHMDIVLNEVDYTAFMENAGSVATNRINSGNKASNKLMDTAAFSNSSGIVAKELNSATINKMKQINGLYNPGRFLRKKNEQIADAIITTPDKIMIKPLWIGAFARKFEKITGTKLDKNKIIANDEAYMTQYKDAISEARKSADAKAIQAGSNTGVATDIAKGQESVKNSKDSGVMAASRFFFNNFNGYMSRFLIGEYSVSVKAINAMMGSGAMSRFDGTMLLAAVFTRMTVYTYLGKIVGGGFVSAVAGALGYGDEDEEPKNEWWQSLFQSIASSVYGMIIGDKGNLFKLASNFIAEGVNEKYFEDLRTGAYDSYEDAIAYSPDLKSQGITPFLGAFAPLVKTGQLAFKVYTAEPRKTKEARARQEGEKWWRLPVEIAGHLNLLPFGKEIREEVNKEIYKQLRNNKKSEGEGRRSSRRSSRTSSRTSSR